MRKKLRIIAALLLPLQIAGVQIISRKPELIERIYSQHLFQKISQLERFLLGKIPFSVGDLLYFSFGIIIIYWLIKRIRSRFSNFEDWGLQAISAFSVIYFLFHFLWGFNYYRLPLEVNLDLQTSYSEEELFSLTEKFLQEANQLQQDLTGNKTEAVRYDFSVKEMADLSLQSFDILQETFPDLNYRFISVKSSIFSLPLTYMGFSGYLNPFTNEAHINYKLPDFKFPTLITHEIAHQLGYAKEKEANFIAALATINHPDPYFRYAGYTFALQYCLNDLRRKNPEAAKSLREKIHPGVLSNYEEMYRFWEAYKNPFEPAFKVFYDHYLVLNNQPEGMKSYHSVVGLLVNYFKNEDELTDLNK